MKKVRLVSYFLKAVKALATRSITIENDCIPFKFYNVPLKKIFNLICVGISAYVKPEKPWGWPVYLQIEPTTLCNLQCALCPVTEGLGRPTGNMNFEFFKKCIDEIGDYVFFIILWDWGEPFINPAIYDMIAYAKRKGIKIVSSTNGHVFAKEANAEKLINSGIDSIIVAIDGTTQETYEHFRKSGSLDTALQGARNLVAYKRTINSPTPIINLRFIVMKHNEHEIPEMKRLAKSLNVDVLTIKTLNPYDIYSENRDEKQAYYNTYLPDAEHYKRFEYVGHGINRHRVRRKPTCNKLWDGLNIRWNGTLSLCSYDYKETYALGDAKTDTIKHIWSGPSYRAIRRQFRSDWEQIQICNHCTYAYKGGSCDGETIVEVLYSPTSAELFVKPENPDKVKTLYETW